MTQRLMQAALFAVVMWSPSALAQPTVVPTFECLGICWSPQGGAADKEASVRYRQVGAAEWKNGYPLWFDGRNSEYRGSIVGLYAGTEYEIELILEGGATETVTAGTWSEEFPIGQVVELPENSSDTLVIDQSGSADGYVLYTHADGKTATIDVEGNQEYCVTVTASYVILRGLVLKNAGRHAIRIYADSHDVVAEECDISGWGRVESDGWGANYDSAVYSDSENIERIIVQRNKMHHPRSDSNCWEEYRVEHDTYHPRGAQAVGYFDSRGNHVIRYNEVYSDDDHRFNDGLGAGSNFSTEGFPNRDSDIYGNIISHCWDDGIEAEGANQNVRIWGNYIDHTYVKIAVAATSLGPCYIFRNVAGVARKAPFGDWDDVEHGGFLKTSDNQGGGKIFVFHNTLLQPEPPVGTTYPLGCAPGLGHGGPMLNTMTRNNILHINKDWHDSISDQNQDPLGDYDYDLYNGDIEAAPGHEQNGIHDVPVYDPNNGDGAFALDPASPGYDDGVVLFNFNDDYAGAAPDMGAFEAGSPKMEFGVDAYRNVPQPDGGVTEDGGDNGGDAPRDEPPDSGTADDAAADDADGDSEPSGMQGACGCSGGSGQEQRCLVLLIAVVFRRSLVFRGRRGRRPA